MANLILEFEGKDLFKKHKIPLSEYILVKSAEEAKNAAEEFLDYHVRNGGVSRYEKFEHFLKVIVPKYDTVLNGPTIKELLDNYATQVRKALMSCEIAPGLQQLRKMVPNATWCARWCQAGSHRQR